MIDILSAKYKAYSDNIRRRKNRGLSWDEIRTLQTSSKEALEEALESLSDALFEDSISIIEWNEIVDHVKHDIESEVDIYVVPPTIIPGDSENDYPLDTNYGSAWSSYKRTLYSKKFDSDTVHMIESSSHRILNKLSLDTESSGTIKGLVIGNVQSGKTANMAALMAMAADQGWNMFIILSGTIDNLRIQTQERLIDDLKSATNVGWVAIDNVTTSTTSPTALSKLNLNDLATQRYLMVCLKNSTRLNNVLTWLNKDEKSRAKLKILVIDDEADQAGVNSYSTEKQSLTNPEDIERTAINKSIVRLLTNKNSDGKDCNTKMKAVNYVAYTATPYANVLNEKPGINSTYPADFVACLGVSNKYFGPQQIFGLESENLDGLDIINKVEYSEIKKIKLLHSGMTSVLPKELVNSILWFYCCFAIKKYLKDNKPVSMLIHTSQKQPDHENMAECIRNWICHFDAITFVEECHKVYIKETKQFTLDDFTKSYPKYGEKNISDYPPFEAITNSLIEIFNVGLKSIKINQTGDPEFGKGVHLCIDNCSHYFGEHGNEHIRLLYPKSKLSYPTGFIVIGGATLSRGLTIEGLVSTYFLRTVKQADSLMQMGRWFGYRIGYELLPRIWMSEDTKEKFEFLSVMDLELRQKMKYMEEKNIKPGLVGINILQYANKKLEITSRNKTKAASIVDMDFAGIATQTTMFFEDESKLKDNYNNTIDFISKLPAPIDLSNHPKSDGCIVWEHISNVEIIEFIKKLQFPKGDSKFLDVSLFEKWYSDLSSNGKLIDWNVAISGVASGGKVNVAGYDIYKTNRSKKSGKDDAIIRIGALRNPRDLYLDVDVSKSIFDSADVKTIEKSVASEYQELRKKAGLDKTSLLIIYIIDKDSKPKNDDKKRLPMNTQTDVIGLTIVIPEQSTNTSKGTHIGIVHKLEYDEVEE